MGTSKTAAAENRARVLDVASGLFCEKGFDGIGVSDLMKAAGLTHGGFYAAFSSKEDLMQQSYATAVEKALTRLRDVIASNPDDSFDALVQFYLSARHRDHLATGCPLAALGSEISRYGERLKGAFEIAFAAHVELVASVLPSSLASQNHEDASAVMAALVGALSLSRSVNDDATSLSILENTKRLVVTTYGAARAVNVGGD